MSLTPRTDVRFFSLIFCLICLIFVFPKSILGQDLSCQDTVVEFSGELKEEKALWEDFTLKYDIQHANNCQIKVRAPEPASDGIICRDLGVTAETGEKITNSSVSMICRLERPGYYSIRTPISIHSDSDTEHSLTIPVVEIFHRITLNTQSEDEWTYSLMPWPYSIPRKLLLLAMGLVIIIVTAWLFISRKRKLAVPEHKTPISLEEEVCSRLNDLVKRSCLTIEEHKRFHDDLSSILRWYIEKRLDLPALEMTTQQLRANLAKTKLDLSTQEACLNVLQHSDIVKFNYLGSNSVQNLEMIQIALDTVLKIQTQMENVRDQEQSLTPSIAMGGRSV